MNKLYLVREIDEPRFRQEFQPEIQAWLDATPFCPIKVWHESTHFISSSEIPDYSAKTLAIVDRRSLAEVYEPYNGGPVNTGKTIGQVDVWADVEIGLAKDGSSHKHTVSVPNTSSVRTCHNCAGAGQVKCGDCGGSGRVTCGRCRGSGTEEESYQDSEVTTCRNCESGYTGTGSSRRVCHQCNGTVNYVKQVTKKRRVTCSRCAGHRYLDCSNCGASGRVTCGTCSGACNLHWWVQCTSEESGSEAAYLYNGQNEYDSKKAREKFKDASLLNSLEGSYVVEEFNNINASYECFANLTDPRTLDADSALKTWIIDYLSKTKQNIESDYNIRVAHLSHTIARIPIVLHRYRYKGAEYRQWINLTSKKVEDHDGPLAQAAGDALTQAKKERDGGSLEKALLLAQRACVIGDATKEEVKFRNAVQWSIYGRYLVAAIPCSLASLGLSCLWGDIQSIVMFGAISLIALFIVLFLSRDTLLVQATLSSSDRIVYGALAGIALTTIGIFQPYVLLVFFVGAIFVYFRAGGPNRWKPEGMKKHPGLAAKDIEAVIDSLAVKPEAKKKAYRYCLGLAAAAVVVYALAIIGYKSSDRNAPPGTFQAILNQRLGRNSLLAYLQLPREPRVLGGELRPKSGEIKKDESYVGPVNVKDALSGANADSASSGQRKASEKQASQRSEVRTVSQPKPETEDERAVRLPISADIQKGHIAAAIAKLAALSEIQRVRMLENDATMGLPLGVLTKNYEAAISVVNVITDARSRQLALEEIRELQATDMIESNQIDKALLVIQNLKDTSRSERLKKLIEDKMPKADLNGF